MRMDVVLSSIQSQGIATVLRSSVFAAAIIHCLIAIAMPHINELSSSSPAQDVSTARSDGKVHLLLAASGSVATIKIPNIIRGLSQHSNLSIRLVLTSSAAHFLQGQAEEQPSLAEIRKYPNVDAIYTDESEWVQPWTRGAPILHIELRKWADLMVIAPLSANTLAKMVHGISDSLLTSVILAWDTDGSVDGKKKKILVATAMNTAMFRSPITQRNLKTLNDLMGGPDGWVEELQTISKGLACGDVGQGGMATWETIVAAIQSKLGLTGAEENGDDETTAVKEEPSSSQKKGSIGNKEK